MGWGQYYSPTRGEILKQFYFVFLFLFNVHLKEFIKKGKQVQGHDTISKYKLELFSSFYALVGDAVKEAQIDQFISG